jgi:hypothetical protein
MRFLNEDEVLSAFELPKVLDNDIFFEETLPNYQLPAVN